MNINALSNNPYIQSIFNRTSTHNSTRGSSIDASSLSASSDSKPQLSPLALVLTTLQQLQQSDQATYQKVTSQIAANLQDASKTASANGNTAQAGELTQLATDFTSASQNNTLPNIQDLAQAVSRGHRHHHYQASDSSSAASSTSTDNTSSTAQSSSSSTDTTSSTTPSSSSSTEKTSSTTQSSTAQPGTVPSTTSLADDLSKLISNFLVRTTSTSQSRTLDPLSIITNTLSNAGISLS